MRSLLALVALLLAGTIATFLRTASLWSASMAWLVFSGMILTFLLGVFTGMGHVLPRRGRRLPERPVMALPFESDRLSRPARPEALTSRRFEGN